MRSGWGDMALILIDSNVLIYAYAVRDEPRQQRALKVVNALGSKGWVNCRVLFLKESFDYY